MHIKRASALLVLMLALSLLLLAAGPAQAGKKIDGNNWICIQARAEARWGVTNAPPTEEVINDSGYIQVPDTTGKTKLHEVREAYVTAPGVAEAYAKVNQHVSWDKCWGNVKSNSSAIEGYWAESVTYAMADPTHWFTVDISGGIELEVEAEASEARAKVDIEIVDNTTKEVLWYGWANQTMGSARKFQESETWQKKWKKAAKGYDYPALDEIRRGVPDDHTIVATIRLETRVNGGWAKAKIKMKPVGGIAFPVDKLALLAPYIALAVALVAVGLGAVSIKKRWPVPKL